MRVLLALEQEERHYQRRKYREFLPPFVDWPWTGYDVRLLYTQEPKDLSRLLEPRERLLVRRINYGSSGIKEVAGLLAGLGPLATFLNQQIENFSNRRQKELQNRGLELENRAQELKNLHQELENQDLEMYILKKFVDLADLVGYTAADKRQLLAAVQSSHEPFATLIGKGKIVSAELREESDDS